MTGAGSIQSLAASPTMVGATTTLIVIVAVFLAYNASNGLPFVPVYRVSVVLPNAQRLSPNNEVRIGGSRVGVVEAITPVADEQTGKAAAKLDLKLDKSVDPLPADTEVRVRYAAAFGLKYLELSRGTGQPGGPAEPVREGGTLPVSQASAQTEFDDIANTFDTPTRESTRVVLEGFGSAFAARGASLNEAIANLNPLFTSLQPVARSLVAPETRLRRLFPALARTARTVAPVAEEQAELFTNTAATFGALSADAEALKATISSGVPTLEQGTVALGRQQPFLADLTGLSARLRPGVADLRSALPALNSALGVGAPTLAPTPPVNAELGRVFGELERTVKQPQTKTTLLRLRETFGQARPLAEHVVPYQTACNYWNIDWYNIWDHFSQRGPVGFIERVTPVLFPPPFGPTGQQGSPAGYTGIQANGRNAVSGVFEPDRLVIAHGAPYSQATGSDGRADCYSGQHGYPLGEALVPGQPPSNPSFGVSRYGPRGTTFTGRSIVPEVLR
jgi:virulence factor Mce-like protein